MSVPSPTEAPQCKISAEGAVLTAAQAEAAAAAAPSTRRLQQAFTDDTIRDAVASWVSDSAAATAAYGPISGWDVSEVTDMYQKC